MSILWAALTGCAHDHQDPAPAEPMVVISISKPTENQSFGFGDTVFFKATITADTSLHGWGIALKRNGDDSLVYTWTNHFHTNTYDVDKYWVNTLDQDTSLTFQLDAAINHKGDLVTKKVGIRSRKI